MSIVGLLFVVVLTIFWDLNLFQKFINIAYSFDVGF